MTARFFYKVIYNRYRVYLEVRTELVRIILLGGLFLKEKLREVLEKYDMNATQLYRGRGVIYCQTENGLRILKEYWGSTKRLLMEYKLKERLREAGFLLVDQLVKNKEGEFIVQDRYRTPFIVKEYFTGRECNIREEEDIYEGAKNLARLHKILREIKSDDLETYEGVPPFLMFQKRNRELKKVRMYMQKKARKNDFEVAYIACYSMFFEEAFNAWEELGRINYGMKKENLALCHGAYHQHNILFTEDGIATVNFEKFSKNNQLVDLYLFLRKVMEKNQYRFSYLETALHAYTSEFPFEREQYMFLYFMFLYPEKFWKISNQYLNDKKCWISPKMLEKLSYIIQQNEQRKQFLSEYRRSFFG